MDESAVRQNRPASTVHVVNRKTVQDDAQVEIVVIHTTLKATRHAMGTVLDLAADLHARIRLLAPHVVPFAAFDTPPVSPQFLANQLLPLTGSISTLIDIRLGRDRWEIIQSVLPPRSLVVIGGGRWWPWRERRLAERLRRQGHNVLFVPTA